MAVIIKEEKKIAGSTESVRVYKTDRPLTKTEREKAEKLDKYLAKELKKLETEMQKLGFLDLKNKSGVIRLWYEVGRRLSVILDGAELEQDDRKYVWRAIYDHAGKLSPGPPNVRANERYERSHFSYCCKLSPFSWEFVEKAGDWTSWSEFFDSPIIWQDSRIIGWLATKQENLSGSMQNWLRPLAKAIRNELRGYDTSVLTPKELYEKLNKIYDKIHPKVPS